MPAAQLTEPNAPRPPRPGAFAVPEGEAMISLADRILSDRIALAVLILLPIAIAIAIWLDHRR